MKKGFYLLLALVLFFASCSEDEKQSSSIYIQLVAPEGYSTLPYEEMEVALTNKDQGTVYSVHCSSTGKASFNVEPSYYAASVHYQAASGLIFSGRIESLSLLSDQEQGVIELPLSQAKINALVIKEIYFGGCMGLNDKEYQADQYVTLYNNSDQTIYLDGLCVGIVDPGSNLESPWMNYTDMKRIPVNDLTWQFPGKGKEYPLAPGEETTIATNAVDHTGGEFQHVNSVDLSGVDWGFWDVSLERQNITAGVKPMTLLANLNPLLVMYSLPVFGPTFMVFSLQDSPEEYVQDPDNREPRPQAANQDKRYLMVPQEWVIDCIECVKDINSPKRVPNELDNGKCYIPGDRYSGRSIIRKKTGMADGHVIYQDTNNSAEDMEVTFATLKTK
ncbi:DUF4876 domain-containing protein [Parabacteroides gordonii]|jgi:hypothetical protein|uniref:DUF4876 domain-containing protein n=1 Tax=Parabacteroides gordonii TaxID=574930 RepID=UPI00241D334B|nr:DUF4876 domain-containing protein [Parabacteroides gordonii]